MTKKLITDKINIKTMNIVLQGKGGVGKSFVASLIAQYFIENEIIFQAIDTDPVNKTLKKYKIINAIAAELLLNGKIQPSIFDEVFSSIIEEQNTSILIDVGSSGFLPILKYSIDNDIFNVYKEHNIKVLLHCIVVGGQDEKDTIAGVHTLYNMSKDNDNVDIVIWRNDRISTTNNFTLDNLLKPFVNKISNIIHIENNDDEVLFKDLENITTNALTRNEYIDSNKYNFFSKIRINKFYNKIFEQLNALYKD